MLKKQLKNTLNKGLISHKVQGLKHATCERE